MWLRCVADELCNALVRCGFEGWEYLHHQGSSGRVWLLHEMAEKEVTLVHIPRLEPSKKLTMKFKEDEIVGTLGLDTACKNCCMGGHYLDVPFCELAAAGTKDVQCQAPGAQLTQFIPTLTGRRTASATSSSALSSGWAVLPCGLTPFCIRGTSRFGKRCPFQRTRAMCPWMLLWLRGFEIFYQVSCNKTMLGLKLVF